MKSQGELNPLSGHGEWCNVRGNIAQRYDVDIQCLSRNSQSFGLTGVLNVGHVLGVCWLRCR